MGVTFVDDIPPKGRRAQTTRGAFRETLEAHPGRWAIHSQRKVTDPKWRSIASRGTYFRRHGYETAFRTVDGVATLYVRKPAKAKAKS